MRNTWLNHHCLQQFTQRMNQTIDLLSRRYLMHRSYADRLCCPTVLAVHFVHNKRLVSRGRC